jgi:hypothetical protein
MKYDRPFEVIKKLSPVSYRLRMPASYGMHPVLNIAHFEKYKKSPPEFSNRPTKNLQREDFEDLPEFEVEEIIAKWQQKTRNGQRAVQYLTRFKGYYPEDDEWLTTRQLKNAPEAMTLWQLKKTALKARRL